MNVQNTLERGFGLSQEGYPVTSLQGFFDTVNRIGWDVIVSNAMDVIFGMRCVFGDRVGLDAG